VPGKRLVLVDGYNVIKNDPVLHALERHSLAVARDGLLTRLMTRFDHETNDITVVFDGPAEDLPVPRSQRRGGVTIIFSQGEPADRVIDRLASQASPRRQVVVISDDREVRRSVEQRGGIAVGSVDRRAPSGNPSRHDDDEGSPHRKKKGNPHRRKKGRRQQPPIHW